MAEPTWKVWNPADTTEPLAEGTEMACHAAVVALSLTHPGLELEDPDGRVWLLRQPDAGLPPPSS
jgi:hypothetical protein